MISNNDRIVVTDPGIKWLKVMEEDRNNEAKEEQKKIDKAKADRDKIKEYGQLFKKLTKYKQLHYSQPNKDLLKKHSVVVKGNSNPNQIEYRGPLARSHTGNIVRGNLISSDNFRNRKGSILKVIYFVKINDR